MKKCLQKYPHWAHLISTGLSKPSILLNQVMYQSSPFASLAHVYYSPFMVNLTSVTLSAPAANSGTQMASVTHDSSSHSSMAGPSSGPSNSGGKDHWYHLSAYAKTLHPQQLLYFPVPPLDRDRSTVMRDPSYFTYTVDFTSLPENLVKPLEQAQTQNVAAKESDVCALKLAISKKVKSAYRSHRVHYPNAQVHPGRRIYDSLAKQVKY